MSCPVRLPPAGMVSSLDPDWRKTQMNGHTIAARTIGGNDDVDRAAARKFASASCLRSRTLRVRLPTGSIHPTEKGRLAAALVLCIVEVAGVVRPIPAFALRAIRCANVRFGFLPAQSNPADSPPSALNPSKEEGPPCGSPFLCMVEVAGVLRPIPAFALRAIRCANVRFGFLPAQSNPADSPADRFNPSKEKGRLAAALSLYGGGGGSRTRVRRRLTPSTTCLAHRSISSSGSTMCETHRSTSLKSFALLPSDGRIRLSHDNDGTSTSMSTSGFPAYALSGECVVVVVGN